MLVAGVNLFKIKKNIMAVSSTYYLNGPSLGSATAVFTNAALTVCAADGFYSDGVIVRELVGCVLLPQQTCPSCGGVVPVWYELSKCSDSSVLYSEEYFQGDFQINERVTIPGGFVCIVVAELLSAPVGLLYLIATTGQEGCPSYNCVSGNCIDPGDGTGTYSTLEACEAVCGVPPVELNVISVGGYMEPCSGGAIDDYMGAVVVLDGVVDVDTEFVVEVFYVDAGGTCGGTQFSQTLNVVILNGSDISNFNACTEGVNFPAGVVICGACISSCDNPSVSTIGFDCPL
jgi:hypothetical protein